MEGVLKEKDMEGDVIKMKNSKRKYVRGGRYAKDLKQKADKPDPEISRVEYLLKEAKKLPLPALVYLESRMSAELQAMMMQWLK